MNPTHSTEMIERAEAVLGSIRNAVLLSIRNPSEHPFASTVSQDDLDKLSQWAKGSGNVEASKLVDELESSLCETGTSNNCAILDAVSKIETILLIAEFEQREIVDELVRTIDESFNGLTDTKEDECPLPEPADEFDAELMEVFAEEAEELLDTFQDRLSELERADADHKNIWEIRRIVHTFKGAAGSVGIHTAAEVAHKLEDKLAKMPQSELVLSRELLDDLHTGLNGLRRILKPQNESASIRPIHENAVSDCQANVTEQRAKAIDSTSSAPVKKSVLRVSVDALETLNTKVDELREKVSAVLKQSEVDDDHTEPLPEWIRQVLVEYSALASAIKNEVSSIRLIEFGALTTRFQRAVRVACEEELKTAEILIENSEVRLDTLLLDALVEPLMHLLRNSVVHGIESPETRRLLGKPESGLITLRVSETKGGYEIVLSDDGQGLNAALLKQNALRQGMLDENATDSLNDAAAFQLIFLKGLSTADKLTLQAGRGIGMGIVNDAITSLGGTIAIDSRPNTGTTFTIKVPHAPGPDHAESLEESRGPTRVLNVDDSASVRHANRKTIEAAGFEAIIKSGGNDALRYLNDAAELPDLILTDLEMPEMSGFELIAAVRAECRFAQIPLIVLSTLKDSDHRTRALRLGADGCIEKPLDQRKLRLAAAEFLER